MRSSFCILIVLGDVLDYGEVRFVEAAETLEAAKRRIETLAASLPGEYVIYDEQTGARLSVNAHGEGGGWIPHQGLIQSPAELTICAQGSPMFLGKL